MLVNAMANEYATQPALCADNSLNNGRGGMLVAWDWEHRPSSTQVHDVHSNQLTYDGTDWAPAHPSVVTVTSSSTTYSMYPDIALIKDPSGRDDTTAFVVWEDILEQCSPSRPKEVVGNWVLYDSISTNRGKQWSTPKMIGPGGGSYTQLRPMAKTSKDTTVNVFWYDDRAATELVMGTRVWPAGSDIDWAKASRKPPVAVSAVIRFGECYPNPLSLTRSTQSNIALEADQAGTIRLMLYDNLGRVAAVIHEGGIREGRHVYRLNAAGLSPGLYHYVLISDQGTATRGLIIVR